MTELEAFTRQVENAEKAGVSHIMVDRHLARRMIDKLVPPALTVGDLVEVLLDSTDAVGDSPYVGRKGKLVNIESLAKNYPYSVEFQSPVGKGASILYFARAELKKVS